MSRKYVIRYERRSYLEVEVEAESMDDARRKAADRKREFDDTYHDPYGATTYPSREDMICRMNEQGKRASIPLDDDDVEQFDIDPIEWGRGE